MFSSVAVLSRSPGHFVGNLGIVSELWEVFRGWLSGQAGEAKEEATEHAEAFVRKFYGSLTPGIPIEVGGNRFPETCVAGMIERCMLDAAQEAVNKYSDAMRELAQEDDYFKSWYQRYGAQDVNNLTNLIQSARSRCSSSIWSRLPSFISQGTTIPSPAPANPCGPGLVYRQGFCISPDGTVTPPTTVPPVNTMGTIPKEMLILGAGLIGLVAVVSMSGTKRRR